MAMHFRTRITELLGIEYPILCGGMQWVTRAEFVAAVCNAGCMGFITAESLDTPEDLRAEIRKARTLTDKAFGINLSMVPEFGEPERTLQFCDIICQEGITVVETAGRSPEPLMEKLKQGNVKIIHKLTSVRHAVKAQSLGVDAVTILGWGSGGHIGTDTTASLIKIPLAVKNLDIPVIAGGSVATGAGFLASLAMGAEAVLMGTAFFTTEESPVHPAIKQRFIQARETDTTLVMKSINNPMRVLQNKLSEDVLALEAQGASLEQVVGAMSGRKSKQAYKDGDTEISPHVCGHAVGLIDELKSVSMLINDILLEAESLLTGLNNKFLPATPIPPEH